MNPLEKSLRQIVFDLNELGVAYALIGGLAVAVYGHERTTKDIDLSVAVENDKGAEELVRTLGLRGYSTHQVLEQTATKRMSTVRLTRDPDVGLTTVVDLLFASSGIEPETVSQAQSLEIIPGLAIKVAPLSHIIAMKVLAYEPKTRPKDYEDLSVLVPKASESEMTLVKDLLKLITERGFNRGKDLLKIFDELSTY